MLFVFALYLPFSLLKSTSFNRSRKISIYIEVVNWHTCIIYRLRLCQRRAVWKKKSLWSEKPTGGFESSLWDLKDDRLPAGVCNAILTTLKKTGNSKLTFLGFSYFLRNSSHTQKINKKILLVLQSLLNIS